MLITSYWCHLASGLPTKLPRCNIRLPLCPSATCHLTSTAPHSNDTRILETAPPNNEQQFLTASKLLYRQGTSIHMLDCRLDSKSLIFFVKKSYLGPRWWHFRNFWPSWSWPIILSYHDSFGSHFHPLHVPIWPNESKTSIWACPDFWYLYK